jgi:hypothetical protein
VVPGPLVPLIALRVAQRATGRAFLGLVFAGLGQPAGIGFIPETAIRLGGVFVPFVRESRETTCQFERPFVSDGSKFLGTFGPFEPTPHEEAGAHSTGPWDP